MWLGRLLFLAGTGLILYLAWQAVGLLRGGRPFLREESAAIEETVAPWEPVSGGDRDPALEVAGAVEEAVALEREAWLADMRSRLEGGEAAVTVLRDLYPEQLVLISQGRYHFVDILADLPKNDYREDWLRQSETGELSYGESAETPVSQKGIDVSSHQGDIDWAKVAQDGVEFAFIRAAYRGYGSGKLVEDEKYRQNMEGALAQGIKVGIYVFSQAVNEAELQEEAALTLDLAEGYPLALPIVYDVEMVADKTGRMNQLDRESRSRLALQFCQTVENAGYKAMVYLNLEMAALHLDLTMLSAYGSWFAYYNPNLYYPYAYRVWQYSESGRVQGIDGPVDMNMAFAPW